MNSWKQRKLLHIKIISIIKKKKKCLIGFGLFFTLIFLVILLKRESHETLMHEKKRTEIVTSDVKTVRKVPYNKSFSHNRTLLFRKKVILLLSNKRSGTSFAGHLFYENPTIFYLFEPLFPFTRSCEVLQQERVNFLRQILHCEFENLQKQYQNAFLVTNHSDEYAMCLQHNLCFSERHERLLLRYKRNCLSKYTPDECDFPLKGEILSETCRASPIVAYKVIRMCDFTILQRVFENMHQSIDLKIIHLIRDPRAILASRLLVSYSVYLLYVWSTIHLSKIKSIFISASRYRPGLRLAYTHRPKVK